MQGQIATLKAAGKMDEAASMSKQLDALLVQMQAVRDTLKAQGQSDQAELIDDVMAGLKDDTSTTGGRAPRSRGKGKRLGYSVAASVQLQGVSSSQFQDRAQAGFKGAVAGGSESVSSSMVQIKKFNRRDLSVAFTIDFNEDGSGAGASASILRVYFADTSSKGFLSILKAKSPSDFPVTGVQMLRKPTVRTEMRSSGQDGSKGVNIGLVVAVIVLSLLLCIACFIMVYCFYGARSKETLQVAPPMATVADSHGLQPTDMAPIVQGVPVPMPDGTPSKPDYAVYGGPATAANFPEGAQPHQAMSC